MEKEVVGIFISGHPLDDFVIEINNFCRGNLSHLDNLASVNGKELSLATICTDTQSRMTKKGNPFGILQVEDYHSSYEFFVFGEDYIKLKPYFIQGQYLFIKGRVQQKKWAKDVNDLEFKINSIELLSELRDKMAKDIVLNIESKNVTDDLIEEIIELIDNHQGNLNFKMQLMDQEEGVIGLTSRSKKVNLSNEFIDAIEKMNDVTYKIN